MKTVEIVDLREARILELLQNDTKFTKMKNWELQLQLE